MNELPTTDPNWELIAAYNRSEERQRYERAVDRERALYWGGYEKYLDRQRKRLKREVKRAADSYIRGLLSDTGLARKEIPQDLVKVKRQHILLLRKLREGATP